MTTLCHTLLGEGALFAKQGQYRLGDAHRRFSCNFAAAATINLGITAAAGINKNIAFIVFFNETTRGGQVIASELCVGFRRGIGYLFTVDGAGPAVPSHDVHTIGAIRYHITTAETVYLWLGNFGLFLYYAAGGFTLAIDLFIAGGTRSGSLAFSEVEAYTSYDRMTDRLDGFDISRLAADTFFICRLTLASFTNFAVVAALASVFTSTASTVLAGVGDFATTDGFVAFAGLAALTGFVCLTRLACLTALIYLAALTNLCAFARLCTLGSLTARA